MAELISKVRILESKAPHLTFKSERSILSAWDSLDGDSGTAGLSQISDSPLVRAEFDLLTREIRSGVASDAEVLHDGRRILEKLLLSARARKAPTDNRVLIDAESSLSENQWRRCLDRILDRLERETSYFHDSVTAGALRLSESGVLSRQLKSLIIPITNPIIRPFIDQPVFFASISVILHPGAMPTPREIVKTLAADGKLPNSFIKLQETVAEILTWPVLKRVSSFLVSSVISLALIPAQLLVKVALLVPRLLGVRWLKNTKLPLFVDHELEQSFSAASTWANDSADPIHSTTAKSIEVRVLNSNLEMSPEKVGCGVKSILTLRALGASQAEIGGLINGARFNRNTHSYPKLERAIQKRCKLLNIESPTELDRLMQLDDAVWRLVLGETRIKAIAIAREEITRELTISQNFKSPNGLNLPMSQRGATLQ